MSSSVPVQQGGMIVVTQMYRTPSQGGCNAIPQQTCTGTSTFSRAHPLALGTVQIMIGVMVFLFGVVEAIGADSLAVFSGFFWWGAGFYITAGSLTVAAGKSSKSCLLNTTLAFNVIATVAAGIATILYAVDSRMIFCYTYGGSDDSYDCYKYKTNRQGLRGVLTVFQFLEFIVTIVVSAFACKSNYYCCKKQPYVYIVPGTASMAPQAPPSYSAPVTVVQLPPQGMPTYPAASTSMADPPPQSVPGLTDPPPYSEETKSFS